MIKDTWIENVCQTFDHLKANKKKKKIELNAKKQIKGDNLSSIITRCDCIMFH